MSFLETLKLNYIRASYAHTEAEGELPMAWEVKV